MNIDELQNKLINAARKDVPADRVPYAFEKRIMAALKSSPVADAWSLWGGALLKAAAPCVAIMLALGVWAAFKAPANVADITLEDTVLAAVTPPADME